MYNHNQPMAETKSIHNFVKTISKKYSDKTAFQIRRRVIREKVTYKDLPLRIEKIVTFLETNKIKKGDKVLIWGLNCPEYATLLLALFSSGRVAIPLDFRTSEEVTKKILEQTSPKIAFVSRFQNTKFLEKEIKDIFFLEDLFELIQPLKAKTYSEEKDIKKLAEIVYTSGTTGIPKGVMITQENILENMEATLACVPTLSEFRTVSILPLSHVLEQVVGLLVALNAGAEITYLPRINSLKLKNAMSEVKPTYLIFVPQMLNLFWSRIETQAKSEGKFETLMSLLKIAKFLPQITQRKLFKKIHQQFGGKLEFIIFGGAPLNYEFAQIFQTMGFNIFEGYGATEVTAVAVVNTNQKTLGTVGTPVKGVEMKLDSEGQILLKSKCVSLGYYKNPGKTREAFRDGWYHTGDIGKIDRNGNLTIIGRDTFKIVLSNGEKVYPEDLEKKINSSPQVKDSCVVGIKDGTADQIHAVLLLKDPKDEKHLTDLISDINSHLESKQQILSYSAWKNEDFPRTHTLKIDRRKVQNIIGENIKSSTHKETELPLHSTLDLLGILEHVTNVERNKIKRSDILATNLKMDSLARAELTALIEEHLGIVVDEFAIDEKTTVGDLQKSLDTGSKSLNKQKYNTWQYTTAGKFIRQAVCNLLIYPVHGFFARIEIDNPKNLKELTPRTLIVFNHAGLFDGACVMRILGQNASSLVTPSYSGFWKKKFLSKFLETTVGGIPVDQSGKNLLPMLQVASDLLDQGAILMLAPQGRLQRNGVDEEFQSGVGFFSRELNIPVVIVKLVDYEKVWPAPKIDVEHMEIHEYFPKKVGTVHIKISKKIYPRKTQSALELTKTIQKEFYRL
jgi:long-chain acyl-CoA synthetase